MIELHDAASRAPEIDEDGRLFWEGLAENELRVLRCGACRRLSFPLIASCPQCASAEVTVIPVSGRGSIYSWVTVHVALDPVFEEDVPYTIVTVELKEDAHARVVGRLLNPSGTCVEAGARLRFEAYRTADGVVLPGFVLDGSDAQESLR